MCLTKNERNRPDASVLLTVSSFTAVQLILRIDHVVLLKTVAMGRWLGGSPGFLPDHPGDAMLF